MSNSAAAAFIRPVSSMSALLGLRFPDGWLWHTIMERASLAIAGFIISFISTSVAFIAPWLTLNESVMRLPLLSRITQNSSCGRSYGFRLPYPVESGRQLLYRHPPQFGEFPADAVEYPLRQFHRRLVLVARPYQYCYQLGIGQGADSLFQHLLPRPVGKRPFGYGKFLFGCHRCMAFIRTISSTSGSFSLFSGLSPSPDRGLPFL